VDGAFGLFARVSPRSAHLAEGVERADSVIADGHKWLNVPYDCGFAFVREPARLGRTFDAGAAYLPSPDDPKPHLRVPGPGDVPTGSGPWPSGPSAAPTDEPVIGGWWSDTSS
jgi:glutamate/tyrosine decarboxylase-like PLP-dependent enzyme